MNKTSIDWCDYSWNPVTGCYNNCFYCYAKKIAERYQPKEAVKDNDEIRKRTKIAQYINERKPFIHGFLPTMYNHRLSEPQKEKKSSKIFVCSMADLFGDWIPDIWLEIVFDACRKAPQHTYLFLTKNPLRYSKLHNQWKILYSSNCWYGITIDQGEHEQYFPRDIDSHSNLFISFEPILSNFSENENRKYWMLSHWLIFGAMTKNGKVVEQYRPKWEWIKDLVIEARKQGIPIFMKQSMKGIVPDEQFTQEYPKEKR